MLWARLASSGNGLALGPGQGQPLLTSTIGTLVQTEGLHHSMSGEACDSNRDTNRNNTGIYVILNFQLATLNSAYMH